MIEHWAFAADLLASVVSSEFSELFGQALDAQAARPDPLETNCLMP
jgi:hypothetical protein